MDKLLQEQVLVIDSNASIYQVTHLKQTYTQAFGQYFEGAENEWISRLAFEWAVKKIGVDLTIGTSVESNPNPLLHPSFNTIYLRQQGCTVSFLCNPTEEIVNIYSTEKDKMYVRALSVGSISITEV